MSVSPGTVSHILWHFTGGPRWNTTTKSQDRAPKPDDDAYKAFNAILTSRMLRLGGYTEVVKVRAPAAPTSNRRDKRDDRPQELHSSCVCCLADIPIAHLQYHAIRYGRFAIGFRRDSALRAGFNPVFYTLDHTEIANAMSSGLASLNELDAKYIRHKASQIQRKYESFEQYIPDDVDLDVSSELSDIEEEARALEERARSAQGELKTLLAYIKTFEKDQFHSIYCEREWRSVEAFKFGFQDIAMLVVPRNGHSGTGFFDHFIKNEVPKLDLPRHVPIVPWEDLLEYIGD